MNGTLRGSLGAVLLLLGQLAYGQQCDALFPTPIAAHDPQSTLVFSGGWLSGAQSAPLAARDIYDESWFTPSCEEQSCQITGVPSATAMLPDFATTTSSSAINVGWFGNQSYQGGGREFGNISIGWLGRLKLAPADQNWRLRNVSVGSSATLELAPGDYWIESLSLSTDARVVVSEGGTARLYVRNGVRIPGAARINSGQSSEQLLIVSWSDVSVGTIVEVSASVYAAGNLSMGMLSSIRGDVAASRVDLSVFSVVRAIDANARLNLDYGNFCSVDDNEQDTTPPVLTTSLVDGLQQQSALLTVAGAASDNEGVVSVSIENVTTGEVVAAPVSEGQYTSNVTLSFGANQIRITAQDAAGNTTALERQVARVDATAPQLILQGEPVESTVAATFTLQGNTSDGVDGTGIQSITVTSARDPAAVIVVERNGDQFSAIVPLGFGDNQITVTATDGAGLASTASKLVQRQDNIAPTLILNNPASSVVSAAQVQVSGQALDAETGIASVVISSDRGVAPLTVSSGNGDFAADIQLSAGNNQILVLATDHAGNTSSLSILVARPDQDGDGIADDADPDRDGDGFNNEDEIAGGTNPDDGNDYPDNVAPEISTDLEDGSTDAEQVLVTGSVTDTGGPYAGIASVQVINQRTDETINATLVDSSFSVTIALAVGDNPISIVARDNSGNSASLQRQVERLDNIAPRLTLNNPETATVGASQVSVSGEASDPDSGIASVTISSDRGPEPVLAASADGPFSANIALFAGVNQIAVLATDHAGNTASATIIVTRPDQDGDGVADDIDPDRDGDGFNNEDEIAGGTNPDDGNDYPDNVAPEISTDLENGSTDADQVLVPGSVTDAGGPYAGIASVQVINQRTDETINATLVDGSFSVTIALAVGDNPIAIVARDNSGNSASLQRQVERLDNIAPRLTLNNPEAATVGASQVSVSGEASDAESGIASVTISSDRGHGPVQAASADGPFSAGIALFAGVNQITVLATDHAGNTASATIVVTRPDQDGDGVADDIDPDRDGDGYSNEDEIARGTDPDNASDYPDEIAPTLTLNNPATQTTTATEIQISGQAADERALQGVTIVSDRYTGSFAVALAGNNFSGSVPLRVGANQLTVTATDTSGNTTVRSITVTRLSPPQFQSVQPASGSALTTDRVTLSGQIITELDVSLLRLQLNGAQVVIGDRAGNGYPFSIPDLPLAWGVNQYSLLVTSPDGSDRRDLTLSRVPEDPDSVAPPAIELLAPNDGQWLRSQNVQVTGRVQSFAGQVSVTVNGMPVSVIGDGTLGTFNHLLGFPQGVESLPITLTATDALGRQTSQTVTVYRDASAPVITLDNALLPLPQDNLLRETPLLLSGTVSDPRLAGMLIDNRSPTLSPQGEGVYRFSHEIALGSGSRLITLSAHDDAGNVTAHQYQVTLDPSALLTPLLPQDGARFVSAGEPVLVQVAARLGGTAPGAQAVAIVGGQTFPLAIDETLLSGEVALPASLGRAPLRFEVSHEGNLIAAASIQVEVIDRAAEPLALSRMLPAGDELIEPNSLITFYFNKPVDPSTLTVSVRETLHGLGYVNQDAPGLDFTRAKGYELVNINRDLEPVPGTLERLADGRSLVFKADRFYGFGATLTIDVHQAEQPLLRTALTVKPLPTQASGVVADQFGQPLADVEVQLGELVSRTDSQGGFSFGFAAQQSMLKGGQYPLLLNPDGRDPRLGTRRQSVYLEQGRLNKLGTRRVPLINEAAGFDVLQGGLKTRIANNLIEIDLTQGSVSDHRGRNTVMVNVQPMRMNQSDLEIQGPAPLFGIYAMQPEGIRVSGKVGIRLPIPAPPSLPELELAEPQNGDSLFLLGLNADRSVLTPLGVAVVQNGEMALYGNWQGQWLDYLALAPVPAEAQQAVASYLAGDGTWQSVRRAAGLP